MLVRYDNLWQMSFPYVLVLHQAPTDGRAAEGFHFHIEFHPPLRSPKLLKYLAGPGSRRRQLPERHVARAKGGRAAGRVDDALQSRRGGAKLRDDACRVRRTAVPRARLDSRTRSSRRARNTSTSELAAVAAHGAGDVTFADRPRQRIGARRLVRPRRLPHTSRSCWSAKGCPMGGSRCRSRRPRATPAGA